MWLSRGCRSSLHSGPRGSGFLTSPVGWELRNTNHLQVIWITWNYALLEITLHYALFSNYFPAQVRLKSKVTLSKLADTAAAAAPRNPPALPNHSSVTLVLSGTKHVPNTPTAAFPLQERQKNWSDVWDPYIGAHREFTPAYLFREMMSSTKIMHSAAGCVWKRNLCGNLASENAFMCLAYI